jgi:hypothetical protein
MNEPNTAPIAPLLAKLHRVAEAITNIEKSGYNKFQKYDFVQAVDVVRTVRELLFKERVVVVPAAGNARHHEFQAQKGGASFLTTVDLGYRFMDVDTGVMIEVPWVGVGSDTGGDKGIYKAYTGGLKYALLNLFLIPTGDDPEQDNVTESPQSQDKGHKDDERPVAPRIPVDRAKAILERAVEVNLATMVDGKPDLSPVFQALLAQQGVEKIGFLNVDQAEAVEAFLASEAAS